MEVARKRLWAAWALLAALQVAYTITASVDDGRLNAVFQHGDYTDSSSSSTSSDGSVVLFFVTLLVNCRTYVLFSVVVSNLSCILSLVILLGKDLFKSSLTYGFRVGAAVGGAAMQFVVMLFVGGANGRYILLFFLASIPALYVLLFRVPYRRKRMMIFLNPWSDKRGAGFQIIQSFIALGSGGLLGVGLGQSRQKLFYLPASHTDFIFSIIGEELGFIGSASIVILFMALMWQGMKVAFRALGVFERQLALGIVSLIGLEAIINIGVTAGALPTKGLPLPFISYGGSGLIFHLAAVGLLLNIARSCERC